MNGSSAFHIPPDSRAAVVLAWLKGVPGARYWATGGLVLISLWVRLLLSPYLSTGYGYTCLYPGVILSAYWLGARPALMAAGLSTLIVYVFMGPQPFSFPTDGMAIVSVGFFVASCVLLIHVLSSIRSRLKALSRSHAEVEALAMSQAELFRDHAQRTTDHLQLISAILHMRARDETDPAVSRELTNAASSTLMISRVHREFTGDRHRRIPFGAFARKLVEAAAARGGLPADRVGIDGETPDIPLEQATSLGLVLLDYLKVLKARSPAATLDVRLADRNGERSLLLTVTGDEAPEPADFPMFAAITEQLEGRLVTTTGLTSSGVRLTFPVRLPVGAESSPRAASLH